MPTTTSSFESTIAAAVQDLFSIQGRRVGEPFLQFQNPITAGQYRPFYRALGGYVPAPCRVLDWGCGNGHVSFVLLRMGHDVTAYSFEDRLPPQVMDGSRRFTFVRGDPDEPTRLPFEDQSFDVVTSVGVLEHVRETGGTEAGSLAEIARVLRPGGRFICCHFPNRYSAVEWVSSRRGGRYTHPYKYTGRDVEEFCAQTDLRLLCLRHYGMLPRNVWTSAPVGISHSAAVRAVWESMDALLGRVLARFAQNMLFVAERPRVGD